MASVTDVFGEPVSTPIHDALAAGVDVLGQDQTVEFVPYVRTVLPLDGFVFWLNAALLTPIQLSQHGLQTADPVSVSGSLHYSSAAQQVEDETIVVRRVDFTAEQQIDAFGAISQDVMYVANWTTDLGSFKFTFSQRGAYYTAGGPRGTNIHHYVGDAIYPVFEGQLIDSVDQFDQRQIVSNSMPLWLSLKDTIPFGLPVNAAVNLYPAFLVPPNLRPSYGTVDIVPSSTRALAAQAWRDGSNSRWQLAAETVRVTFYGLRNDEVMDWIDYVVELAANRGDFGVTNMPVPRDERRSQFELAAIAQKKVVDFEITYYQTRMRDIARQMILDATLTLVPADLVLPIPCEVVSVLESGGVLSVTEDGHLMVLENCVDGDVFPLSEDNLIDVLTLLTERAEALLAEDNQMITIELNLIDRLSLLVEDGDRALLAEDGQFLTIESSLVDEHSLLTQYGGSLLVEDGQFLTMQ